MYSANYFRPEDDHESTHQSFMMKPLLVSSQHQPFLWNTRDAIGVCALLISIRHYLRRERKLALTLPLS